MITRGIRAFVARDWRAVREGKDAYWHERVSRLGPGETFRIADQLRRQARMRHERWPTPEDRQRDLRFHVRLAALLRRAHPTRRP